MDLQAITGTLYIVDGQPQENTPIPGLLAQRAPKKAARGRENDFLFVHLTLENPPADAPDALTQDLLDALVSHYYQTSGSVISALRRAILHINSLLLRWNVNSSGRSREGALTCAVLRNNELYIVQVGEALAFIGRNFGIERIPANPPDLVTPLGRSANLDFRFGHYRLQPADMLLLTEPAHNHLPASIFQPALVDTEVEIGLEELADIIDDGSGRLMLLEFSDEPPIDFPAISQLTSKLPKPASLLENMPTVRMPKREDGQPLIGRQQVEDSARQATAQAAMGLSKASSGVADMLRQLQPEEEPPNPDEPRTHWAVPAAMAIIIPIVVIAIVMSVYLQYGRVAEFSQLRQDINQAIGLAQQAEDESEARQYYNQVLQLAAQAEQIRPGETTIATQRQAAIRALDRLDGITRLIATPLYTYPEESRLTAIEIQRNYDLNGDVYVLDKGVGQVTRHHTDPITLTPLEEEPETLVFSGQAIQNHVVGDMVDLLWRPSGSSVSRDGIAILDSRGQLITFYTNFEDLRTTPFDLSSEWRNPIGLIGFSERVYVIDNEAQRIWRYFPDGDALQIREDNPAITFGVEANLNLVVSAAIYAEDGSVILLYADGHLRRYDSGPLWTEEDLREGGLEQPLVQPAVVRIVGQGLNSSIFVLDPGSGRLLQFSLGGILLAQYRATDENGLELLARASDFAIAEDPLRVFITAGNQLYVATLE